MVGRESTSICGLLYTGTHCPVGFGFWTYFYKQRMGLLADSASHNFYIKPSKLQIQLKALSRLDARIWNEIPTSLRGKSRSMFKSELHNILLKMLRTHDDYLNISQIGQAIKLV